MLIFSHNNRNILANWWWTVDKTLLLCLSLLLVTGTLLTFSASPAVAERIGLGSYYFVKRHLLFAPVAFAVMIFFSMQRLKFIRRMALIGYLAAMFLVICTFFFGEQNKGASRWLVIFGFSLQPSEFVKPFFIVTAAWLFNGKRQHPEFPGYLLSVTLFLFTALLIFRQPDIGMTMVITAVWLFQFFLSGMPIVWLVVAGTLVLTALTAAYFVFPHFQIRIHQFLASGNELAYQVKKSLEAFQSGSLFGRGPGEGIVRSSIPDAHTDFIYAVAGEEYGVFLCLAIVALYLIIVVRSMIISCKDNNLFIILSASGLAASFGLQSVINMASTLHMMPTKGMTLPFISYGGSSILATAVATGMLLAITRKNVHAEDKDDA